MQHSDSTIFFHFEMKFKIFSFVIRDQGLDLALEGKNTAIKNSTGTVTKENMVCSNVNIPEFGNYIVAT